jgi:hypothetical protein
MIAIGGGREEVYLVPFFRTGRAWALLAPLLASCASVGPDHQPPERAVPPEWREETREGLARGEAELEGWWRRLGDPVLDRLVDRAALEGLDLREALLRVQEARARRRSGGPCWTAAPRTRAAG